MTVAPTLKEVATFLALMFLAGCDSSGYYAEQEWRRACHAKGGVEAIYQEPPRTLVCVSEATKIDVKTVK